VSDDAYNNSEIKTVLGLVITANIRSERLPGNVLLSRKDTGLPKPSVVNVTQIMTIDKAFLLEKVRKVSSENFAKIDFGLRGVLSLV